MNKPILLTGDTPTGKLHLGHWVGSVANRVKLQSQYQCYFLVANTHAFTTRVDKPSEIRSSVLDIVLDYLAMGIDPQESTIFIESDIPAIFELASLFSMLIPFPRLMRNPTIKEEIRDKGLGDHYSMGFLWYPILQVTDILAFQASIVPVGEDQIPHIELTREVARRFYQLYCGIDSQKIQEVKNLSEDDYYFSHGKIFPIPKVLLSETKRLVGIGPPSDEGFLLKMSKSLNNAIFISDSSDEVKRKVMSMYTDPNRLRASDPGTVENNPLWLFHDAFNPDKQWLQESKQRYREGKIGDVECKKCLVDVINTVLQPMRDRRKLFENDMASLLDIVKKGADKANIVANDTLFKVKSTLRQMF